MAFADSKNPANDFLVQPNPEGGGYIVGVRRHCNCGSACCARPEVGVTPHTSGMVFADEDDAYEWIESVKDLFEEQYDRYLEENHDAIVQQERYEAFLMEN